MLSICDCQVANGGRVTFSGPGERAPLDTRQLRSDAKSSNGASPERKRVSQHTRKTYAVTISFFGPAFSAWAWAPGLAGTAQGVVQDAIAKVVSLESHTQVRCSFPLVDALICSRIIGNDIGVGKLQVVVNAAGRTDKGVSAYGQVVSFLLLGGAVPG